MTGSKKRVLVPLAPGFEELEAIAVVDLLRRAGCHVVTASVAAANPILGRNRMRVMADLDLSEALAGDLLLMGLLARRLGTGAPTAAICAAPGVLARAGLPRETAITGHPACRGDLAEFTDYRDEAVVRDGAVVTSRGPGTAVAFALALVELLFGADRAKALATEIVYDG